MALTRSFKELVQKRVASDPAFGEALLREGIDSMLIGDVDIGKAILRDYIKATVGPAHRATCGGGSLAACRSPRQASRR